MERRHFLSKLAMGGLLAVAGACARKLPTIPNEEASSLSELPNTLQLDPDPRKAVQLECLLAVMGWDWSVGRQIGGNAVGDWNYLASDLNAYGVIKGWYPRPLASAWDTYYSSIQAYGFSGNYGRGGQCVGFANTITYRSGIYQRRFPTYAQCLADYNGPRNYTKPVAKLRIGDIIRSFSTNGHTAIVVRIMSGQEGTSVTSVDLVDANWVGGMGQEVIGRHVISKSGSGLSNLNNYYAVDLLALRSQR
jgi:hypothetical protein